MPSPDLCTEEEVTQLVHGFYDRVRRDAALGPIFEKHVSDWDAHMPKMVDFWSSALRGTARFRGTPMPKHTAIPGLTAALFGRWLTLFHETTAALANEPMRKRANDLAQRIAESLWYGWQVSHGGSALPEAL
ncbi:MAG: group III truncated hemoglobin [Ramlibacter sp.]|nr:group III truncated hemoglobin [Ramlibacter sp.]